MSIKDKDLWIIVALITFYLVLVWIEGYIESVIVSKSILKRAMKQWNSSLKSSLNQWSYRGKASITSTSSTGISRVEEYHPPTTLFQKGSHHDS